MTWRVTVAAVVERDGRFLVVEERPPGSGEVVWNQPAGHVDPGEPILDALVRETLEETGLALTPTALVGVYQLRARDDRDYFRVCFAGTVPDGADARPRDPVILACRWVTRGALAAGPVRSGLVVRCVDDFLAGARLPLSAVAPLLDERAGR
ncbi:MAG: NUDIX hydrolase [Thermoanaerobaculia bacterium]